MSMRSYAYCAEVIADESVKMICPLEYRELMVTLENHNHDLDDLAILFSRGDLPEDDEQEAYDKLKESFDKKTKLKIGLYNNSDDEGDIQGHYFSVDGMYKLTPAGKKYNNIVGREFFIGCG